MIAFKKIAPIDDNHTGYDVLNNGRLLGQVYGYVGQSASREYREWTVYLDGEPLPTKRKTRWEAVELLVESRGGWRA